MQISVISITDKFTGPANTSVVCCLQSLPFEISENKEVIFSIQIQSCPPLLPKFEVHRPLVKNLCSKGSYSLRWVGTGCLLHVSFFRMTFLPVQFPSLPL